MVDSGTESVNQLNAEVERKTREAIEDARKTNKELDRAYKAVLKPMSFGGIWSGAPIYVRRPVWPTYVMGLVSLIFATNGAIHSGLLPSLFCVLVMFLWYDFYSGVLHVVLDEPRNIDSPLIGQPALEFQWHHFIPADIYRKDFSDVLGDLNLIGSILVGFHFFFSTRWGTDHLASTLAGLKLFGAWYGQISHRCAHNPKISEAPVGQFLQKLGLMISVKDHKAHHQHPHDEDFCLIGPMNPVIDLLRKVTTNRHAWLVFFLTVSLLDIFILARMCKLVFP